MTQAETYHRALATARRTWGPDWSPTDAWRAPGRLELIGNHIDYNGGPVLAAAIDRETACLLRASNGSGIEVLLSDVSTAPVQLDPDVLKDWRKPEPNPQPLDYVRGVIATAIGRGDTVRHPIELAVAGDVPIGLGLSSSASLCVALTLALHRPKPNGRDLVLRAQEAEHRAGSPCGTMDQAASVGGHVILYDGQTTTWSEISPDLGAFVFAVADSGVSRALAASSYPRRVKESRDALARVNQLFGRQFGMLAELEPSDLAAIEAAGDAGLPGLLKQRVRHVVSETARVRDGVDAMSRGDWAHFGALMTASGRSSAVDYEISHPRVEEIAEIARGVPGVVGSRMMGGGEGGIALILLERGAVAELRSTLNESFYTRNPVQNPDPVAVFRFAPGAGQYPSL